MKYQVTVLALIGVVSCALMSVPIVAHHGTGISYDQEHPWTTKATVTEFRYENPHPSLFFDRVNDKGDVEHWVSELQTNPSFLIRAGWTKTRSVAALKPGTVVTLTLATSKAGGNSAVIAKILNEQGQEIVSARAGINSLSQGGGAATGAQRQ